MKKHLLALKWYIIINIVSITCMLYVFGKCKGRETHEVYKIAYMDGSIKFKTYTYQH